MFLKAILILFLSVGLSACGPSVTRNDRPLTLAETKRLGESSFPFPASAHNIHYAIFQDFGAPLEYIVRFDAPPVDCQATIAPALAWHYAAHTISQRYQPQDFAGPIGVSSYLQPVAWFDNASIRKGIFAGEESSHTPTIWVDSETGRFYYRTTD